MLEMLLPGRVSRSRAWRICSPVIAGGRPRCWPRAGGVQALAGALHERRPRMRTRPGPRRRGRPAAPGVVVSRASCSDRNPTPRRRSLATRVIRSWRDRDSRSRLGTTRVSPAEVVQARGRRAVGGLARQLVGEHPDAARLGQARVCRSRICPDVDTRAYPISAPVRFAGRARAGRRGRRRVARGRQRPPDRMGNGGAGVVGHPGFSTRFQQIAACRKSRSGPSGGPENRSILDRPDRATASERSSRAGTLEAGKLPPSRGVRARRTTGQRPVAATVRA